MAILRTGAKVISLTGALGLTVMCSTTLTSLTALTTLTISTALPAHAAGNQNQAIQKYNAKDYQGALNEFKAVYAKEPKNSLCRYYMALCNQCLARVDEAKKDYQWVVDNGTGALKAQAQAGLAQLEKVTIRSGGSASMAATPAATTATTSKTADGGKAGTDLIERSKDPAAKDAGGKDASGKSTASGGSKPGSTTPTKTAAAGGNVAKVLNFFSDASRQSQLMEQSWEDTKAKYPKITFQKVNAGEALCDKYGITEFPTIIVLDKSGKALATQAGQQSAESMASTIDTCNDKK
jgi:predicted Zn-dependent protease